MARIQILELPEGAGDERPPFVLVVDEVPTDEAAFEALSRDLNDGDMAERIGARAVLVFEDTIDIPANDATAYSSTPAARQEIVLQLAGQDPQGAVDAAIQKAKDGQRLAHERTNIARDMDRLAKWKNELTDALGMDRTRDWDDIRNAARGIRKQRDAQGAAIERVRNLHRPVEHRGQTICWECSAYDFPGKSTDNAPVAHDQCGTIRALSSYQE